MRQLRGGVCRKLPVARKEVDTFAHIELLMNELGPVSEPLAIQFSSENNCWGVLMEEDLVVVVGVDEEQGKLVLSSELGESPQEDRVKLYELLLAYNVQWEQTGGGRLGVDGPGGTVVLLFDVFVEGLDVSRLSNLLASFADIAGAWREIVQCPDSAQDMHAEMPEEQGIRV